MDRFDGTAARQLPLPEDPEAPRPARPRAIARPPLRLLRREVYAELERRRRRAQIRARTWVE